MSSKEETKKSSRIAAFDLLRGYFLISIIINHLNYPSVASLLTMKGELFVSSAEGFFLISGIVLGIVRGAKLINKPFKNAAGLLLKRAGQLYLIYFISTTLFTLVGWWFFMDNPGLKPGIASPDTPIHQLLWNIASFKYLYGWLDYLRLYIFFLLASPIAIWLLRKGLWWLVLMVSVLMWHFTPELSWPDNVYMQPYNWQVIFFSGLVVGFHWKNISAWWQRLKKPLRVSIVTLVVGMAAATLAFNIFLAFGGKISPDIYAFVGPVRDTLSPYFDKENLPLARLSLFMLWFWASFWLFRKFEPFIVKWFGWLLQSFGGSSLYVYIVHGILIFFVHLFLPKQGYFVNLLIISGIVATIWLMIRYKVLMKVIPR